MLASVRAWVERLVIWACSSASSEYQEAGALEHLPQSAGDVNKVAEHLDLKPECEGVINQLGQVRVQGGFTTDELHQRRIGISDVADHTPPILGGHGAVRALRPTVGVAMDARQLALSGDLQPNEAKRGNGGVGSGWYQGGRHVYFLSDDLCFFSTFSDRRRTCVPHSGDSDGHRMWIEAMVSVMGQENQDGGPAVHRSPRSRHPLTASLSPAGKWGDKPGELFHHL